MHSQVETIPQAGLTIIRKAINPDLIKQFEAECAEISTLPKDSSRPSGDNVHEGVKQIKFSTSELVKAGFRAAVAVLKISGRPNADKSVVNHQLPHSQQKFHADSSGTEISEENPLVVIQATDGGVFDYAPTAQTEEEAEAQAIPIEVNAGDIIIQTNPNLLHRGRNPSNHDRYNLVAFNVLRPIPLEEAITESQAEIAEAS